MANLSEGSPLGWLYSGDAGLAGFNGLSGLAGFAGLRISSMLVGLVLLFLNRLPLLALGI